MSFPHFIHGSGILEKGGVWAERLLIAGVLLLLAGLVRWILLSSAEKYLASRGYIPREYSLRKHFYPSLWIFLSSLLLQFATPLFNLSEKKEELILHLFQILIVLSASWVLIRISYLAEKVLYQMFDVSQADNYRQRRARTQIQFIFKIVILMISILGLSAVLLTFPGAKRYGTSLLASAGIVSVVVGLAAQKSLGNFLAGFQIAFTQPIRLDDVVIVEGEWGRVEEISLTYVIVKIWDLRRLVLPITYFTEKPFQNWTRTSSQLLGYIYLYVDFEVPVPPLREELSRILKGCPLWNGEVGILQVTDISEKTVQLRALMGANDASIAFDLRCLVREKMLEFIKANYPESFPRTRVEMPAKTETIEMAESKKFPETRT